MTIQDWCRQLEAEPDNWDTYQAFSDWLKDHGMVAVGHAVWWMWKRRKRPAQAPYGGGWVWRAGYERHREQQDVLPLFMLRHGTYSAANMWAAITWLAGKLQEMLREYNAE